MQDSNTWSKKKAHVEKVTNLKRKQENKKTGKRDRLICDI